MFDVLHVKCIVKIGECLPSVSFSYMKVITICVDYCTDKCFERFQAPLSYDW